MCAYKADVRHSADEDDYSHNPIVFASDIEDVSAINSVVHIFTTVLPITSTFSIIA